MFKKKPLKKKKYKTLLIISLLIISLAIFSILLYPQKFIDSGSFSINKDFFGFSSAQKEMSNGFGTLSNISLGKEWIVTHSDGEESKLTFWSVNSKDKKTEIGFLIPEGEKCSDWKTSLNVHDSTGNVLKNSVDEKDIKPLTCESAKCDGKDCYYLSLTNVQLSNLQDLDYIKLGENSQVIEYQDINLISYQSNFANINISLSCENVPQNDIWVESNPDNYKFGAIGNFEGLRNCSYNINSTENLKRFRNGLYVLDECEGYLCGEKHFFNFEDVCSKEYYLYNETYEECIYDESCWIEDEFGEGILNETCANETKECENKTREVWAKADCQFNINGDSASINFLSDNDIDPSAEWWNSSYTYRKQINISNDNVDGDLSDFPVLVKFSGDDDINSGALANGYDIRFANESGAELAYEREFFNGTDGVFWVKTDVDADNVTSIYLYYGNETANAGLDGADPTNVWDSNFLMVQHMTDATTSTILDSTSNDNDGDKKDVNEPIEATGKINKGQDYDGTDDAINGGSVDTASASGMTVSVWSKASLTDIIRGVVGQSESGGNKNFALYFRDNEKYVYRQYNNDGTNVFVGIGLDVDAITDEDWHHIVGTWDGTTVLLYIDASTETTYSESLSGTTNTGAPDTLRIGDTITGSGIANEFLGVLDEVRISNTARSADWIKFEYYNMNEADNELTWGSEKIEEGETSTSFTVQIADGQTEINFTANNKTVEYLNPVGQNGTNPIIRITNTGDVSLDFFMRVNATESGFVLINGLTNNTSIVNIINTTLFKIKEGLATSGEQEVWLWLNWTEKSPQTIDSELNISTQETT